MYAQSKKQSVSIDSTARGTGETRTNFHSNISNIGPGFTKCALKTVNMFRSEYPFGPVNERTLIFQEGATVVSAVLSAGNYSISALCTAIGTVMTAASTIASTYTAAYNSITSAITITSTAAFIVLATSSVVAWTKLGYTVDSASATTAVADSSPNIPGVPYYLISIPEISTNQIIGSTGTGVFRVDMNAGFLDVNEFDENNYKQVLDINCESRFNTLTVVVTRPDGVVPDFRCDWSMMLEFSC